MYTILRFSVKYVHYIFGFQNFQNEYIHEQKTSVKKISLLIQKSWLDIFKQNLNNNLRNENGDLCLHTSLWIRLRVPHFQDSVWFGKNKLCFRF